MPPKKVKKVMSIGKMLATPAMFAGEKQEIVYMSRIAVNSFKSSSFYTRGLMKGLYVMRYQIWKVAVI